MSTNKKNTNADNQEFLPLINQRNIHQVPDQYFNNLQLVLYFNDSELLTSGL